MDAETISTLKTVCATGHVRSGFNGDANARLEELAQQGLLVKVSASKRKGYHTTYKPTEKGKELARQLSSKAAF